MEINRVENNANRGREYTNLYFSSTRIEGEYSRTRTETIDQKISLKPIGSVNRKLDAFHI